MIKLPNVISAYFDAKNRQDIEGMIATFADAATVRDEGEEHRGRAAIRAWMTETTRKYRVTARPTEVTAEGNDLVVASIVTGDFPGSPATLRYRFTLAGNSIIALEVR